MSGVDTDSIVEIVKEVLRFGEIALGLFLAGVYSFFMQKPIQHNHRREVREKSERITELEGQQKLRFDRIDEMHERLRDSLTENSTLAAERTYFQNRVKDLEKEVEQLNKFPNLKQSEIEEKESGD